MRSPHSSAWPDGARPCPRMLRFACAPPFTTNGCRLMGHRKRTRWIGSAAAVAAVAVSAFVIQRTTSTPTSTPAPAPRVVVALVQTITGGAIAGDGAARHLLDSGSPILAGDSIETAGGAATSLAWGGSTLRLDGGTRIHIASARELDLQRGAVYVASDHPSVNGV